MKSVKLFVTGLLAIMARAGLLVMLSVAFANSAEVQPTELDRGFKHLYNLNFKEAQREFSGWQKLHPDDAVGHACEAVGIIFEEFSRLGVLESELFTDNEKFTNSKPPKPDAAVKTRLNAVLQKSETMANAQLARDPKDASALFALTMVAGMRSDYLGLIEKRYVASLKQDKLASEFSNKVIAIQPDWYDAYLASGVSQYVVGSLIAPLRWGLQALGYEADKKKGVERVKLTAERGRYFAPYARILLAVVALRDKQPDRACQLLEGLKRDYPDNPLFSRELERIQRRTAKTTPASKRK
jgi:hypothetical protein